MAYIQVADAIVPAVFTAYTQALTEVKSRFVQSGVRKPQRKMVKIARLRTREASSADRAAPPELIAGPARASQEERMKDTSRILAALAALDPENDEHWTSDGLPSMAAVIALAGEVTRRQVEVVEPEFSRTHLVLPAEDEPEGVGPAATVPAAPAVPAETTAAAKPGLAGATGGRLASSLLTFRPTCRRAWTRRAG